MSLRLRDWDSIDSLRGPMALECMDELIDEYWHRDDWGQRAMLITLLGDHRDPRLQAVMRHALEIPETKDDIADEVRSVAVSHLGGGTVRELFLDRDLLAARVAELRARMAL